MKKGVKTGLKITAIVFGTIAGLFLLTAAFISPVAEYVIEKNSKSWIGRQILMEDLSVNLFTGSLEADDLKMKERDDKTDFVSLDTLRVAINPFRLLAKEVNIRYITLSSPRVSVIQYDSTFNFTDLTRLGSDDDKDEAEGDDGEPWAIGIYNIRLKNGTFVYKDEARHTSWNLDNLHLAVPGVYFSGKTTDAGISFNFAEGGSMTTQAKYDMEKGRYDVRSRIEGLAAENFLPYLSDMLNVSELSGKLGLDVHLNGSTQEPTDIDIEGLVKLKGFRSKDDNGVQIADVNGMEVKVNKVNPMKGVCDIDYVTVDGLSSHFDMYKDHNNFTYLVKPSKEGPAEEESGEVSPQGQGDEKATESKTMVVRIGKIAVKNSDLTFTDNTLRQRFTYTLGNIDIESENFSPSAAENSVRLRTETQGGGSAMVMWKGGTDGLRNQSLTLFLKNVNLKEFTPYSMEYFAYPLANGKLSVQSQNNVRNYSLVGRNKLDIYNCRVGDKTKGLKTEFNIPLKTGLYILRDKDDKIMLDLPVKGNVNSPEFSYKKLILKTLCNLLIKVATAPMNALASGLGLSPDELSRIHVNANQPGMTSEDYAKLDRIAEVVGTKPEMTLQLTQKIDMENAIKSRTIFEMKRRYYVSQHPEKAGERLTLIDFGEIRDIKDGDDGLEEFVKGISPASGGLYERGAAVYSKDSAVVSIKRLMGMRSKQLSDYLQKKGVKNLSVKSIGGDTLMKYSGEDAFFVEMENKD